ncbi:MAG: hypothetical protein AB7G47_14920 [Mycolicibacterium sp.]|uniref:hypothetical protein n=1 Tax=Mycolicibacterium sp. TaxID=2320850 RepID=UPI003D118569
MTGSTEAANVLAGPGGLSGAGSGWGGVVAWIIAGGAVLLLLLLAWWMARGRHGN